MFCSKCGKEVPEGTKFCPACGADISIEKRMQNAANDAFNRTEQAVGGVFRDVRDTFNGNVGPRLTDNRSLLVYILLSLITCGIYHYYFVYTVARDMNTACDGDGQQTQGLVPYLLLSIVTCGIYSYIWYYQLGNRLAYNAPRYGLSFQENGTTILIWFLFGSLLCGIGPFIALYILMKNMNQLFNAYNRTKGF